MAISLLVIDDHEIIRHGIESLLEGSPVRICGMAATAKEALKLVRSLKPQVVLLDVRLGGRDGLELVKRIRVSSPETRVVVFSAFDNPTYVARAVSAGAHDYILKTLSRGEVLETITAAAKNQPPMKFGELHRMAGSMATRKPSTDGGVPLTPRETQTLRLLSMGLANKEIGDAMDISVETVKEHVQNLLRKLGLNDRTQAAVWAIRHGIG